MTKLLDGDFPVGHCARCDKEVLVGVVLDQSDLPEIVGTICGDDTIFIACRSADESAALSSKLRGELQ